MLARWIMGLPGNNRAPPLEKSLTGFRRGFALSDHVRCHQTVIDASFTFHGALRRGARASGPLCRGAGRRSGGTPRLGVGPLSLTQGDYSNDGESIFIDEH